MPFTVTNRGLLTLLSAAIRSTTDIRQAVFKGAAPGVAAIRDMNYLADLKAVMAEATAA